MKVLFILLALCALLVSARYYGHRGYYGPGYRRYGRPYYGGRRFGPYGRRFGPYGRRFGPYGRGFFF